jgi:hypothetical protein
MKSLLFILYAMLTVLFAPTASALDRFSTQSAAQHHCLRDTVVWLNIPTGIWHYQGERWYGRTRDGADVCEGAAARAGDREAENGQ